MNHNNDMIKLVKLVEGKEFAGEEVGQKPGDQVRGTDKAKAKGTDHPFKGRLVGEDTTLEDVLTKKYQDFKDIQAKEKAEKKEEAKAQDEEVEEAAPALVRGAAGLALGGLAAAGTVPMMGIFGPVLGMGMGAVGSYKAAQWGMQGADALWDKVTSLFGGEKPAENFAMLHAQASIRGDKTFTFGGKEYPVTIGRDQAKPAVQAVKAAVQESQRVAEASNPADKVTMDIPLLIRLLEYAREDAQTDMDLHNVTEKLIKLSGSGQTLSMQNYDTIVGQATEQMVSELGADGSALGAVAAAKSAQAALSTKPSPVSPDGKPETTTTPAAQSSVTPAKPGNPLTPDEQEALDKIKANAGLKSQYDRLVQQAAKAPGV